MNTTTYSFQNVINILQQLPTHLQQEIADFAEFVAQKHRQKKTVVQDPDEIYKLTSEQKSAVKKGLDDLKNKRIVSDENANKRIDEWLKK